MIQYTFTGPELAVLVMTTVVLTVLGIAVAICLGHFILKMRNPFKKDDQQYYGDRKG